jgi:P27 family predicted phage terminase small subunit
MSRQNGPNAPQDFETAWRKVWRDAWRQLNDQGTWQDTDRHLLELYVRALRRAESLREYLGPDPVNWTTTGSKDQEVPRSEVKMLREAELDAGTFADKLLLSPQARKRAGADDGGPDEDDPLTEILGEFAE